MTKHAQPPIRPKKLAHIVLRTNVRFEEMCEWYRNLLNGEYIHKDDRLAFMTYDEEHHRVAVVRVEGMVDRPCGTVGLDHVAFTFASISDLLETYARLKQAAVEPILAINHGPTTSIYYEDPDRNRVEIQVDNFDTVEDATAFLSTGVLAVNPLGVAFNADEMVRKLWAGVTDKTLKAYPLPPVPVDPKVVEILSQN